MTPLRLGLCVLLCCAGVVPDGRAADELRDAEGFLQAGLGRPVALPADHGSHPETRTEWWYLNGSLQGRPSAQAPAKTYGPQITFFRSRVDVAAHSASRCSSRLATGRQ